MGVVLVKAGESPNLKLRILESSRPIDTIGKSIGRGKRKVRFPIAKELEIVDRSGGDFRGRFNVGNAFTNNFRDAPAIRIEHSAGPASCNGKTNNRSVLSRFPGVLHADRAVNIKADRTIYGCLGFFIGPELYRV